MLITVAESNQKQLQQQNSKYHLKLKQMQRKLTELKTKRRLELRKWQTREMSLMLFNHPDKKDLLKDPVKYQHYSIVYN